MESEQSKEQSSPQGATTPPEEAPPSPKQRRKRASKEGQEEKEVSGAGEEGNAVKSVKRRQPNPKLSAPTPKIPGIRSPLEPIQPSSPKEATQEVQKPEEEDLEEDDLVELDGLDSLATPIVYTGLPETTHFDPNEEVEEEEHTKLVYAPQKPQVVGFGKVKVKNTSPPLEEEDETYHLPYQQELPDPNEEVEEEEEPEEPGDEFPSVEEHPMLKTKEGFSERVESDLFYGLQNLVLTLVVIVLVFSFVGRLTQVKGESMMPTLVHDEMLLVWSLGYQPKQGDIVIVNKLTADYLGGDSIVKRVIALEGQSVLVDYPNNQVLVDGVPLPEDYTNGIMEPIYGMQEEVVVPEGSVFVLGDNRNHSSDSRDSRLETINEGYIMGKAVAGIWPLNRIRLI